MANAGHSSVGALRPSFTRLPDGRGRMVVAVEKLGHGAAFRAELRLAKGTLYSVAERVDCSHARMAHLAGLRLVDDGTAETGNGWHYVRTYEDIDEKLETLAGRARVTRGDDGRITVEQDWLQFSSATATPQQVGETLCPVWPVALTGVTGVASTDAISRAQHGLLAGDVVRFTSLTGGGGLATATDYHVRDVSADSFRLAASAGGAALDFTTDITAASLLLQVRLILVAQDAPDDGTLRRIKRVYKGVGVVATQTQSLGLGLQEQTRVIYEVAGYTESTLPGRPAGEIVAFAEAMADGYVRYSVTARQAQGGGALTDGALAFSYGDKRFWRAPGRLRCVKYNKVVLSPGTIPSEFAFEAIDVLRRPPADVEVNAVVNIYYTTTGTLAGLVPARYAPATWASVETDIIGRGPMPYHEIQDYPGYAVDTVTGFSEVTTTTPSVGPIYHVAGGRLLYGGGNTHRITAVGPSLPVAGESRTLDARLEPAFTTRAGVKWYRKTQVLFTVPGLPDMEGGGGEGGSDVFTPFANPMTASGDLIIGAAGGVPARLARGVDGQVLRVTGMTVGWAAALDNPMTTAGDMIVGGASGAVTRLAGGTDGYVLTMVAGAPAWTAATFSNPMTTAGDLIVGGAAGAPGRLGIGGEGEVLTVSSGVLAWTTIAFTNPMTTAGDMIVGGASGAATRVGIGSPGQVLTVVGGTAAWADAGGGGAAANYFGDSSDGDTVIATNTTLASDTGVDDTGVVIRNYGDLTINSGVSLTAAQRVKAMLLYVDGDLTVNGALHMDARGAAGAASDIAITRALASALFPAEASAVTWIVPAAGAAGGAGGNSGNRSVGGAGVAGSGIQTGGGGGGSGGAGGGNFGAGGAGAAGTAYVGGSGGGGGCFAGTATAGGNAGVNGGAGGAAGTGNGGQWGSGGGAGNPGGARTAATSAATNTDGGGGGGGTLILVVRGTVTVGSAGRISSDGGAGGNGNGDGLGGGGAGGGVVLIRHGGTLTVVSGGVIRAAGGAGGTGLSSGTGGAGGAGSVSVVRIFDT